MSSNTSGAPPSPSWIALYPSLAVSPAMSMFRSHGALKVSPTYVCSTSYDELPLLVSAFQFHQLCTGVRRLPDRTAYVIEMAPETCMHPASDELPLSHPLHPSSPVLLK